MSPWKIMIAVSLLGFAWPMAAWADFDAAARYSADHRGVSMLVMIDGEVVFENYPGRNGPRDAHVLASGTKSFSGVIAAALVQDGLLDLDERVSDTLTEWQGDGRRDITVRQLLHLTAGLDMEGRVARAPSYADAVASRADHEPGTLFEYHPAPFQIFGELVTRKLNGESPLEYLDRRIFEPIEMNYAEWRHGRDGNPHLPSGAQLTARDWARFGQFILQGGVWDSEQLLDPDAFAAMFKGSAANPAYGLTWWLNEPLDPEFAASTVPMSNATDFWTQYGVLPDDMVMAAGAGNQRLYISWERNIVVVRQADGVLRSLLTRRNDWSDVEFWRLLQAE